MLELTPLDGQELSKWFGEFNCVSSCCYSQIHTAHILWMGHNINPGEIYCGQCGKLIQSLMDLMPLSKDLLGDKIQEYARQYMQKPVDMISIASGAYYDSDLITCSMTTH